MTSQLEEYNRSIFWGIDYVQYHGYKQRIYYFATFFIEKINCFKIFYIFVCCFCSVYFTI